MLLAIDTSTRQLSLALHDGERLAAEVSWRTANYHTMELAPQVALMLRRAGTRPEQLAGIAVAIGPGSYTSLRVGLGFAKGLALAHDISLIGVPTFEIVMRAIPPQERLALALVPAGRGRLSVAAYRCGQSTSGGGRQWQLEGTPRLLTWAELTASILEPAYICGEIEESASAARLPGLAELASPAQRLRRAGFLAEIGWERLRKNRVDDASQLSPIYGVATRDLA
jgi:tRNA threonylcarbamoyladenosine biosynthesis protein TsaB